jgi:hypothetical protein
MSFTSPHEEAYVREVPSFQGPEQMLWNFPMKTGEEEQVWGLKIDK